jgi:hypothetical protein
MKQIEKTKWYSVVMFLSQFVDITKFLFSPCFGVNSKECILHTVHSMKNILLRTEFGIKFLVAERIYFLK